MSGTTQENLFEGHEYLLYKAFGWQEAAAVLLDHAAKAYCEDKDELAKTLRSYGQKIRDEGIVQERRARTELKKLGWSGAGPDDVHR